MNTDPPPNREERKELERFRRYDARMDMYERTGQLYAATWEETIHQVILNDLEEELGPTDTVLDPDEVTVEEGRWASSDGQLPFCTQCGSYHLETFESEAGWGCEKCNRPVREVWGCLECARVVCDRCLVMRRPKKADNGMTLTEIGQALGGYSRERVRQMIEQAIGHLRSTGALEPFLYEELTSYELFLIEHPGCTPIWGHEGGIPKWTFTMQQPAATPTCRRCANLLTADEVASTGGHKRPLCDRCHFVEICDEYNEKNGK